jgi:hypothetical protein
MKKRAVGEGPTLAGSGRCTSYNAIDDADDAAAMCVADEACLWRKASAKSAAHCALISRSKVIKRGGSEKQKAAASTNPWLLHLAAFRKANPQITGKAVLTAARATYTPVPKK